MLGLLPSKSVGQKSLRAASAACEQQHGVSLHRFFCGWDESLMLKLWLLPIGITLATFSPERTTSEAVCGRCYFHRTPSPQVASGHLKKLNSTKATGLIWYISCRLAWECS